MEFVTHNKTHLGFLTCLEKFYCIIDPPPLIRYYVLLFFIFPIRVLMILFKRNV